MTYHTFYIIITWAFSREAVAAVLRCSNAQTLQPWGESLNLLHDHRVRFYVCLAWSVGGLKLFSYQEYTLSTITSSVTCFRWHHPCPFLIIVTAASALPPSVHLPHSPTWLSGQIPGWRGSRRTPCHPGGTVWPCQEHMAGLSTGIFHLLTPTAPSMCPPSGSVCRHTSGGIAHSRAVCFSGRKLRHPPWKGNFECDVVVMS